MSGGRIARARQLLGASLLLACCVARAILSCDDDPSAPGDSDASAARISACRAYYEAACARLAECGNPIRCDDLTARCPDALLGGGTTRTVDSVLSCAQVRRSQSCAEILAGKVPSCATPGTRAGGEPCHFDAQCASGRCLGDQQGACGKCAALARLGEACDRDRACGDTARCTLSPTAFAEGICTPFVVPPDLASGAACSADPGSARCPPDQPCLVETPGGSGGSCRARPAVGAACAFRAGGAVAECTGGSCLATTTPDAGRTCGAPRGLGEPCGSASGAVCTDDLTCSSPTEGTCRPRLARDESCGAEGACQVGLFCSLDTPTRGYCREPVPIGQACLDDFFATGEERIVPCAAPNACRKVKDRASRICVGPAVGIGEACDPIYRPCGDGILCGPGAVCVLEACPADGGT